MWLLIDHASDIAGLRPLLVDERCCNQLELECYCGRIDVNWFAQHLGHELVAMDEYGREGTRKLADDRHVERN